MKRTILTILALFPLFFNACKSEQERNQEKMEKSILKHLEDQAFKNNYKINIIEFAVLSFDTLNENLLDTFKLDRYFAKIQEFNKEMDEINKLTALELQSLRLYASIDHGGALYTNSKEKIDEYGKEIYSLSDSSKHYFQKDSLLRIAISKRKNPKPIYQAKFFIKAVYSDNGKTNNVSDTLYSRFNDKLELLSN